MSVGVPFHDGGERWWQASSASAGRYPTLERAVATWQPCKVVKQVNGVRMYSNAQYRWRQEDGGSDRLYVRTGCYVNVARP